MKQGPKQATMFRQLKGKGHAGSQQRIVKSVGNRHKGMPNQNRKGFLEWQAGGNVDHDAGGQE